MKLSVVIPAHNEEGSVAPTVEGIAERLEREAIEYDVLVIDDASRDRTKEIVEAIGGGHPRVRCLTSYHPPGFGFAVRCGLEQFGGDAVAIMMADGSDSPERPGRLLPGPRARPRVRLRLPLRPRRPGASTTRARS